MAICEIFSNTFISETNMDNLTLMKGLRFANQGQQQGSTYNINITVGVMPTVLVFPCLAALKLIHTVAFLLEKVSTRGNLLTLFANLIDLTFDFLLL